MIHGIARAINIVSHAFSTNEEIRTRAQSAHDVKTLIHSSRKGCFEEQIDIVFSKNLTAKIGSSVIIKSFWDYLTYCWAASIGADHAPTSNHLQKVVQKDRDFGYFIGDALESAMQDLHKPIVRDVNSKIFLERPRVGDVLEFNHETLAYVTNRFEKTEILTITGNVTRFNVLSDFGRFYSDLDERTVSFKFGGDNKSEKQRLIILESMKDGVRGESGKLKFHVSKIMNSQDFVKCYVVHEIEEFRS
jgi:hypothetical protein